MYGWPHSEEKHFTFDLLRRLNEDPHDQWVCIGDFNQILSSQDQEGGLEPNFNRISLFRSALDECGLLDLRFSGPRFTWDNA